jgi:hypothetical protein
MIHEAYFGVLAIQTIYQSGVYPHPLSEGPVSGNPMRGTTTIGAAVKLENLLVPCVSFRGSFALLESNFVAVIVRPKHAKPTAY